MQLTYRDELRTRKIYDTTTRFNQYILLKLNDKNPSLFHSVYKRKELRINKLRLGSKEEKGFHALNPR